MKSTLLIGIIIALVTLAITGVLWMFISTLEDNSVKMRKFKTTEQWMNEKAKMGYDGAADQPIFKGQKIADKTKFVKSSKTLSIAEGLGFKSEFEKAAELGEQALKETEQELSLPHPKSDEVILASRYAFLGMMHTEINNPNSRKKALEYLSKAIEIDPNNPYHWRRRAKFYAEINEPKLSLADKKSARNLEKHMDKDALRLNRFVGNDD